VIRAVITLITLKVALNSMPRLEVSAQNECLSKKKIFPSFYFYVRFMRENDSENLEFSHKISKVWSKINSIKI
jgi:hypothetical protein